jgi:hypothetical protein
MTSDSRPASPQQRRPRSMGIAEAIFLAVIGGVALVLIATA